MKKIMYYIFFTAIAMTFIPAVISLLFFNHDKNIKEPSYLKESPPNTNLEEYIIGVVAAEMPATFPEEALKAQAVAARTYALRAMEASGTSKIEPDNIGQAYDTELKLMEKWGDNFDIHYKKIADAVKETEGEILVYEGELIEAVFHSTSGGMTERSENVWKSERPYLVSVDSSFDEKSPYFKDTKSFKEDFLRKTLSENIQGLLLSNSPLYEQIKISEYTDAGYVKKIIIGNKEISGNDIRMLLGLRSSMFEIEEKNGEILFLTKGYGHGAGMSQYGAKYLAESGFTYEDILKYYYKGVVVEKYH